MKDRIRKLSPQYCLSSDRSILTNVKGLPEYQKSQTIFCYVGTDEEINTSPLILDALTRGKRVGVPRCTGPGIMHAYEIESLSDLSPGSYGILEPGEDCPLVSPEEIDMACIPCLSADRDGRRLGYGGGFYDRYLEHTSFPRIILCREELILHDLPVEDHDQRMDILVTESGVTRCGH